MHFIYLIKHFVAIVATPLACGLLLALAGGIARLFGRRTISGGLWIGAAFLVYLSSTSPVADALLLPLERRYPPLANIPILPPVTFIVVLGNGYGPRDDIPVTAALPVDGLARIAEGVRLMHQLHGARLVVSGGAIGEGTPSAVGYAKFAADLEVDERAIVKLDKALDTAEEADSVAALVGASPFILVTSAYHMPRAMRLMQRVGAHPIPAPTGHLVSGSVPFGPFAWIPTSASLRKTECALHEYMGLAAAY